MTVDTEDHGLVALDPDGYGSRLLGELRGRRDVGSTHEKGDPLGNFLFGGSDFIMLFQKDAEFDITAPKADADVYDHILVGEEYGVMEGEQTASRAGGNWWVWLVLAVVVVGGIGYFVLRGRSSS